MTPEELAREAIAKFNKKITNEVFLTIQNDRDLMQKYLRVVETKGLNVTNQIIGKVIKARYHLENIEDREYNPSCTLIQSHQKFK